MVYTLKHTVGDPHLHHTLGTPPPPSMGRLAMLEAIRDREWSKMASHDENPSPRLAADEALRASPAAAPVPAAPSDPRYAQVRAAVERLDADLGRPWDDNSRNMTASLYALAVEKNLERVDHVLIGKQGTQAQAGEYAFVVQGDPMDPAHLRARMKTLDAVNTPEEVSLSRTQGLQQDATTREQVQSHAQEQEQQQRPPTSP